MDVALNGFLSQLTDDVKKEKEKEPEKPEKPEILSFKKKGFELEKKDSDDSDEVSWRPHWKSSSSYGLLMICLSNPSTSSLTGNQEGLAQTVQKETEEDEQIDSGRAQTGNIYFIKITIKTTLEFIV